MQSTSRFFSIKKPAKKHSISPNSKEEKELYPIPKLATLDALVAKFKTMFNGENLSHVVVIAVQHNLETTVSLYRSLKELGVRKIFTLGKCYSDSPEIVKAMQAEKDVYLVPSSKPTKPGDYDQVVEKDIDTLWQTCLRGIKDQGIDTIIVLDDGGRCLIRTPSMVPYRYKIAGVEQTRGGLYHKELDSLPFPIIEVASSALKKYIEAPFIADAVISTSNELLTSHHLTQENAVIGIIGKGIIGTALAQHLVSLGYVVNVYDEAESAFTQTAVDGTARMHTMQQLIARSHCIFSCIGKDISQDMILAEHVTQDTLFVSCSSEDKEFRTELKKLAQKTKDIVEINPLSNFTIYSNSANHHRMVFINGGYPVNFNKRSWNVPQHEIEPTQAALLSAVIQGILIIKNAPTKEIIPNKTERIMLSPDVQQFIVDTWQHEEKATANRHSKELLLQFGQLSWIQKNSGGLYQEIPAITQHFPQSEKSFSIKSRI